MKIAIITGASTVPGAEFARAVAEKYGQKLDQIWIIAKEVERLEHLAGEISSCTVRPVKMDLSSRESFLELRQLLKNAHADIRILINSEEYRACGQFDEMDSQRIYDMIDLNITALTMINRCCFPFMQKGSFVILACSAASAAPVTGQAVYRASEAYVRFLGKALHAEMKPRGVNILTLCSGSADTHPDGSGSSREISGKLSGTDLAQITRTSLDCAAAGKGFYTPGGIN